MKRYIKNGCEALSEKLYDVVFASYNDEKQKFVSNLSIVIQHLLKWKYQPERRGSSWKNTIEEHRERVGIQVDTLRRISKPSELKKLLPIAYKYGVKKARAELSETSIVLPDECPWSFDDLLNADYMSW